MAMQRCGQPFHVEVAKKTTQFSTKINNTDAIGFRTYAQNCEKQTYQIATLEKFYPSIPSDEIIETT